MCVCNKISIRIYSIFFFNFRKICTSPLFVIESHFLLLNSFCLFKLQGSLVLSISTNRICLHLSSSFLPLSFHVSVPDLNPIRPNNSGSAMSKSSFHSLFKNFLSLPFFPHPFYFAIPFQQTFLY